MKAGVLLPSSSFLRSTPYSTILSITWVQIIRSQCVGGSEHQAYIYKKIFACFSKNILLEPHQTYISKTVACFSKQCCLNQHHDYYNVMEELAML